MSGGVAQHLRQSRSFQACESAPRASHRHHKVSRAGGLSYMQDVYAQRLYVAGRTLWQML